MEINIKPLFSITKSNPNIGIFVAHSDDETIWAAGLMLERLKWNFNVHILTDQPQMRYDEAINARNMLQTFRQNIGDEETGEVNFLFDELIPDKWDPDSGDKEKLFEKLDLMDFDRYDAIVTHNIQGEYGHIQHIWIGEYFKQKQEEKPSLNVWHFFTPTAYKESQNLGKSIVSLYLNREVRENKLLVMNENYLSQLGALWNPEGDYFMNFQFYSGCELFTNYQNVI
jgi:hypothetical protein